MSVDQITSKNVGIFILLKPAFTFPTTYNIQKFCVVLTLRLCVFYESQKYISFHLIRTLTDFFCIIQMESVHCAVRTEFLYKTDTFHL
jgi:hypothetical protein